MTQNHKIKLLLLALSASFTFSFASCSGSNKSDKDSCCVEQTSCCQEEVTPQEAITAQEVAQAQEAWGEGIVHIGKVFSEKGDYKAAAEEHIKKFYNYDKGLVLFKPTMASQKQFRLDFAGALSYFVAGDKNYPEDHGFAIKPWSKVRFENIGTTIEGNVAYAMGNYYFTPAKGGDEVKVEYTFVYKKNSDSKLKLTLHGSHLPYQPKAH